MSTPRTRHGQEQSRSLDQFSQAKLLELGFTMGLIHATLKNLVRFVHFFWIIDNSASTTANDGHRIRWTNGNNSGIPIFEECRRWDEIVETTKYNIRLAELIDAPTSYRLLNHPGPPFESQFFNISSRMTRPQGTTLEDEVNDAIHIMSNINPNGATPLTDHIIAIRTKINSMKRRNGEKVVIVIATDGTPTDIECRATQQAHDSFTAAVRSFYNLDVHLVVRLSTDEKSVVNFWSELDSAPEVPLDVLDDYVSEAKEVHKLNPWLTYGLPIHRMREMGMDDKLFDDLDEKAYDLGEIRQFLCILFDDRGIPDLCAHDWMCFCNYMNQILKTEKTVYNPIQKKMTPWVDMKVLRNIYCRQTKKFRLW